MAKIYYEKDANLKYLKGKTIGIIGYGIQGRGQALNLRDSGLKVLIGQRPGGPNYIQAKKDGFKPVSAFDLAKQSDVIVLLAQDPLQASIYKEAIAPNLKPGKALVFSHGFNIHFKQIVPPKFVDVFMVAPKGPGSLVRRLYEEGKGVPCLFAIYQDASKQCKHLALAYAKGLGGTKAGVLQTTFKEETETDLFGEQAVLCGGVSALVKAGFDTLVKAGYQPEIAYFECLHELKLITDMIYATGIQGMRRRVSDTAEYGDLVSGPRVVGSASKKAMQDVLKDIQKGRFAKQFLNCYKNNRRKFESIRRADDKHPIEKVGSELRSMMSWL